MVQWLRFHASAARAMGSTLVRELRSYTLHSVAKKPVLKWITNKDLLYSTGNSAQRYVTT